MLNYGVDKENIANYSISSSYKSVKEVIKMNNEYNILDIVLIVVNTLISNSDKKY